MTTRRIAALTIAAVLTIWCAACGSTSTSPSSVTTIALTGSSPAVGGTSQLTVTATMTNGSTQDVTSQSTFQVANTAIATVSSSGLLTGVASGTTAVTATYQTFNAGLSITVP